MTKDDYEFVELPLGRTCYQTCGDKDNPVVVFIHGLSSPMCIWDKNFNVIADAGFYAVRYDLYGRGYSARPRIRYDIELFRGQLKGLLTKLDLFSSVHLVGLSMGGGIAVDFASRYPDWVKTVTLIAPAGLLQKTVGIRVVTLPILGAIFYELYGKQALLKGVLSTLGDNEQDRQQMLRAYQEQMRIRGYREALISTLRHGPLYGLEDRYERLGQLNKRGKLIWGTKDDVVPIEMHHRVLQYIPWLEFHPIENGTHAVNYQQPEIVNSIIIELLKSN